MPESIAARRSGWLAALLGIFALGVSAYLYVGRPRRALLAAVLGFAVVAILWHGLSGRLADPSVFAAFLLLGLILFVVILVDVVRIARRTRDLPLKWYNRWWVYLGVIAAFLLVNNLHAIVPGLVTRSVASFSIQSGSSEPTLLVGETIIADMRAYRRSLPERGDLVLFDVRGQAWIHRIVGLPGDRIQMIDGVLQINGVPVGLQLIETMEGPFGGSRRRYRETLPGGVSHEIQDTIANASTDNTQVFVVPEGQYFMMGDNRDNATDSRVAPARGGLGTIPLELILGKASGIMISRGPDVPPWQFWNWRSDRLLQSL